MHEKLKAEVESNGLPNRASRILDAADSGSRISGMTQSEAPVFGSNQVIGAAIGVGLVVVAFAGLAWLRRRTQIARGERPPQRTKLLHPPGYSLACRIEELSEKLTSAEQQAVVAGAVLGLAISGFCPLLEGLVLRRFTFVELRSHPQFYMVLTLTALALSVFAWTIRSFILAARFQRSIRNFRFGLRGEQAVAEALADRTVVASGYFTFHDVPGEGAWNVDHIVVGPGGIFVLETKTRARRKPTRDQPDHEVWFGGRNLQFPWCDDRKAVAQAERNTEWVKRFVSGFAPADIPVYPIVVIPGWYVKTEGNHAVKAMNAKYLTGYLPSCEHRFSPEQLQTVMRRLDERCRDLEF